jgi:hypothetical protein
MIIRSHFSFNKIKHKGVQPLGNLHYFPNKSNHNKTLIDHAFLASELQQKGN